LRFRFLVGPKGAEVGLKGAEVGLISVSLGQSCRQGYALLFATTTTPISVDGLKPPSCEGVLPLLFG
jgi:hypothetical protein